MAATRIIEEDHGTYFGTPRHPHQGYYAGDFGRLSTTPLNGFAPANQNTEAAPSYSPTTRWS